MTPNKPLLLANADSLVAAATRPHSIKAFAADRRVVRRILTDLRAMKVMALAILCVALTGCRDILWPAGRVCTGEYRMGLNVFVKDSISGAWAASGAMLMIRDGAYADSSTIPANRPDLDALPLFGAGERAGVYTITVRKPGFADWGQAGVRVTKDECHVNTRVLTAQLVRASAIGQ